ncbi:MAG: single-stranded-DNA-specific exonuclease RecJ [Clostridia bacterium]|nr:single-stranded-DNA-specific exonuclease RecJ [Clostridia bacterium]
MNRFQWKYGEISPYSLENSEFSKSLGISPVLSAVCRLRGIADKKTFDNFIEKSPLSLHSPFLMKDMDKAVERIRIAIQHKEQITVYGDYDVDGITSVLVLVSYIRSQGGIADYYIPDRADEGYGVNIGALCSLYEGGSSLVITVDTGITACKEIEAAKEMGMDVIVTDHHSCKEEIPDCVAVVNPTRPDCPYPFKSLAGVGVVFKLICGLENGDSKKVLDFCGDLVALGTVADVVDLRDENRVIVSYGIEKMNNTSNIGLSALISAIGLKDKPITVPAISFNIAPKINAAGRIGDAGMSVSLLLSSSPLEANELASQLIDENVHRQELEKQIYQDVINKINKNPSFATKPVLVVWGEGWHGGVIGIVSSKITEKYSKPCILITLDEGIGKGSGRSVEGFNLVEAMNSCPEIFIKYGGHALAAGLTIYEENLKKLDTAINKYAEKYIPKEGKKPVLMIDCPLNVQDISIETTQDIQLLSPFGPSNSQPVFSAENCVVTGIKQLTEGKHIRLFLKKEGVEFDAIGFGMGEDFSYITNGDIIDVAGNLSLNEWNGNKTVQFVLKDIRFSCTKNKVNPVPSYDECGAVYTYIRKNSADGFLRVNKYYLENILSKILKGAFNQEKIYNILCIFRELTLLSFNTANDNFEIYMGVADKKVDLNSSRILQELLEKGEKN